MSDLLTLANAVMYEGYMLWPYRPSALKNQRRWTFGCVFPPAWTAAHPDDACLMRTQVLLESDPHAVEVTVRYLTADGVKRVRDMVMNMEKLGDARELTDAMRAAARQ